MAKNNELEVLSDNNLDDMTKMMSRMTAMMNKLKNMDQDIDSNDPEMTENTLKDMLGDVGDITKSMQSKIKAITSDLAQDPSIPKEDKKKYAGLAQTMNKLTSAISTVDSDPDKAEKMMNELMGQFDSNMESFGLSSDQNNSSSDDISDRVDKLETKVSSIDDKLEKLIEITKKMSSKLSGK